MTGFDFHEVALALPLIAMAYIKLMQYRHRAAVFWAVPLMLVKEDSVFLLLGVAMVLLVRREWKLSGALTAFALSSFALIVAVIIPRLSHYGRYTYWTASSDGESSSAAIEILRNAWDSILSGDSPTLLFVLIVPFLGLCLRSPLILGVLPVLGSRLTSPNPAYWALPFHYNATIAVVIALAAVDGLRRLQINAVTKLFQRAILIGVLGLSTIFASQGPAADVLIQLRHPCRTCGEIKSMLSSIPDGSRVAADDTLTPYLVDRTQVYGFHTGPLDSSGKPIPAQWLAIDLYRAKPEKLAWVQRFVKSPGVQVTGWASFEQTSDGMPLNVMTIKITEIEKYRRPR